MAGKENPTTPPEGERIAKVLSRRGVASRREAERLIEAGEVKVNGKIITSPALNVTDRDKITVSGQPLPEMEPARLWLYYKPDGLVTSEADEKGRETVFANLPEDMPRVMSVGRLDLNSEGLLLLTNDGELKRRLELPSTGWLRKYRVRINGNPTDPDLEPLRKGVTIDGEKFQPMSVVLDRIQGANAWLTVGLREGKNREIRRAMAHIGLTVNRLIRVSYGPFRLGELKPGEVEEVRQKVLRDQLGEGGATEAADDPIARKPRSTPLRRVRPGEGVKALAKAWDEATTPRRAASRKTETDKETGSRRTSAAGTPPRGPRPDRDAPDRREAPSRTRTTDPSGRSRRGENSSSVSAPRSRDEGTSRGPRVSAPAAKPRARQDEGPTTARRSGPAAKPAASHSRAERGEAAKPRPPSAAKRAGTAPAEAKSQPRKDTSNKGPTRPAAPKGPRPATPRPPTKPRRG